MRGRLGLFLLALAAAAACVSGGCGKARDAAKAAKKVMATRSGEGDARLAAYEYPGAKFLGEAKNLVGFFYGENWETTDSLEDVTGYYETNTDLTRISRKPKESWYVKRLSDAEEVTVWVRKRDGGGVTIGARLSKPQKK